MTVLFVEGFDKLGVAPQELDLEAADPFAFFYAPETDPCRLLTPVGTVTFPHLRQPDREATKNARLAVGYGGGVQASKYNGSLEDAVRLLIVHSPRRWSECPGASGGGSGGDRLAAIEYPAQDRNPMTDAPCRIDYHVHVPDAEAFAGMQRYAAQEPTVRVVRGAGTLGRIPRPTDGARGNCHAFTVGDQCLVLPYEMVTADGGWNYERVFDAGDTDIELLERLPGWQPGGWDPTRYRR